MLCSCCRYWLASSWSHLMNFSVSHMTLHTSKISNVASHDVVEACMVLCEINRHGSVLGRIQCVHLSPCSGDVAALPRHCTAINSNGFHKG